MKLLIASDIHGSAYYCRRLLDVFNNERADRLVLLGDLLYHGPRNSLPRDYSPNGVIEMLNSIKEKILCVRGNCDTEVDQMVLFFPILADYAVISAGDKLLYLTHGHKYNKENPLPLTKGDILINGHTHIPECTRQESFVYINSGSVSIPKNNSAHSYMIYENGEFLWKNLESKEIFASFKI